MKRIFALFKDLHDFLTKQYGKIKLYVEIEHEVLTYAKQFSLEKIKAAHSMDFAHMQLALGMSEEKLTLANNTPIEALRLIQTLPIKTLRVIQDIPFENVIAASIMSPAQMQLALDITEEKLALVKNIDIMQLKRHSASSPQEAKKASSPPTSILRLETEKLVPKTHTTPLNILLLVDNKYPANTTQDYNQAFTNYSMHKITPWCPMGTSAEDFVFDLKNYHAVIISYSICILYNTYIPHYLLEMLHQYSGVKALIIQDEYRWVNRITQKMEYLGIDILISSLNTKNIEKVYHHTSLQQVDKYHSLPGYIPKRLLDLPIVPMENRQYHLSYRGRTLAYNYGAMAQEKSIIADEFLSYAKEHHLSINISNTEENRIYGNDWINLVSHSKAVLGVEGGVSIFDFDDMVLFKVRSYLAINPGASFEEVSKVVLQPYEGNIVHRTITPRIFEAISLRTALVLYPGDYSGIIKPWEHYIPLEKNGSNSSEVIKLLQDDAYLTELTERAYHEIALNPELQYKKYIEKLDSIIARKYQAFFSQTENVSLEAFNQ